MNTSMRASGMSSTSRSRWLRTNVLIWSRVSAIVSAHPRRMIDAMSAALLRICATLLLGLHADALTEPLVQHLRLIPGAPNGDRTRRSKSARLCVPVDVGINLDASPSVSGVVGGHSRPQEKHRGTDAATQVRGVSDLGAVGVKRLDQRRVLRAPQNNAQTARVAETKHEHALNQKAGHLGQARGLEIKGVATRRITRAKNQRASHDTLVINHVDGRTA